MDYLIVVDMQKDFIDGALGTKEAEAILPAVVEKVRNFSGRVIFTRDTHGEQYLDTQEGQKLPVVHCIQGTEGWEIAEALSPYVKEEPINKGTFGSTALAHMLARAHGVEPITSITLVGLCTDICVISNAMILKASLPEVPVFVDAACCAGVTPESHKRALDAMKVCQIEILNDAAE